MTKRDDIALIAFIDSRHATPYAWGRSANDCVGFALDAVAALTGVRVAPRVKWTSRVGAARMIRKFGSLEAAFDAYFERVPAAFALPGDIAAVPDEALGIHPMVVEGNSLVCPGERGNRRAHRRHMIFAWSATALKD